MFMDIAYYGSMSFQNADQDPRSGSQEVKPEITRSPDLIGSIPIRQELCAVYNLAIGAEHYARHFAPAESTTTPQRIFSNFPSSTMTTPQLFQPTKVGEANLAHRIVLAPMTRYRASADHIIYPIAGEYYAQRASTPGTLLISEALFISPQAGGMKNVPGIWNDAQVAAWKPVSICFLG